MNLKEKIAQKEEELMEKQVAKMNHKEPEKAKERKHRGRPSRKAVAEQLDKAQAIIQNMKRENEVIFTQESLLKNVDEQPRKEIDPKATADQLAKADSGKPRLSLVPMEILTAIARIREYGNLKYKDPDNWKTVSVERYRDAMMRHMVAYIGDPKGVDQESGLPHLWHLACNVAFLVSLEGKAK